MAARPRVLCVGGSDPHAGAGLQMDAAACVALGADAACVATLDTVQGAQGLEAVSRNRPADVARGMLRALEEGVGAVKLGALGDRAMTEAVVETLDPWVQEGRLPLVIDPVATASRSLSPELLLNTPRGIELLGARLFPHALVTPNVYEYGDGSRYAECRALLVKGGHAPDWEALAAGEVETPLHGEVVDRYRSVYGEDEEFRHPRIPGATGLHGTGCALASAIAALLARGFEPRGATELALDAMQQWLSVAGDRLAPFRPRGGEWDDLLGG